MAEIIPSINMASDLSEIEEKIRLVEGHVDWVHIDIVDGKFATPSTWPYSLDGVELAPRLSDIHTKVNIELHLMTQTPEDDLDEWLDTQAKRILIHYEASADPRQALTLLSMSKIEEGLVLNMGTKVDVLSEHHDMLELIQLMTIAHIGPSGIKFDENSLSKIRQVKQDYPKLSLQVDGGMNEQTIKKVLDAGADRIVVGSAIFKADNPLEALTKLQKIADNG